MRLADETPGTRRLFAQYRQQIWDRTDRMFLWLLLAQWLAATAAALWASPEPWDGLFAHLPSLAYKAFGLGAVIATLPVIVALRHPGSGLTRREIAVGQGLMTSLLIHVSGGRPEMHYVIFASLPFLAMYRDVSVLLLASMITAIDHVLGCFLYPQSVYGVAQVSPWAWVNDVGLLAVENAAAVAGDPQEPARPAGRRAREGGDRGEQGGARARGRGAAAHGAAAVAAIHHHARARGRAQPARGGARHPAHRR